MRLLTCAATAAVTLTLPACGGMSCTDIGGGSGVSIRLPVDLYGRGRTVDAELCQGEECRSSRTTMRPRERAYGELSASVAPRRFAGIFEEGPARLTVTVRDGRRTVRVFETDVDLAYDYPNGRDCDGDIWLGGEVDLA
jgi:hypothetical protein